MKLCLTLKQPGLHWQGKKPRHKVVELKIARFKAFTAGLSSLSLGHEAELQGSSKEQRQQRVAEVTNQTEKEMLEPTDSRTVRGQSVVIPAIEKELLNRSEQLIKERAKLAPTEVCVGVTPTRKRDTVFIKNLPLHRIHLFL